MILTEQETMLLNDLKQQEELCRDKYAFYSSEAKDPELKQLFEVIQKEEAEHYDTISSLLSGDTVTIVSAGNTEVTASNIVGTNGVSIVSGKDTTITSAEEVEKHDYEKRVKKSGLLGGGLGFTIGSEKRNDQYKDADITQKGSTIGSIAGNVTIEANKDVHVNASDIIAGKDISLTGENVDISSKDNVYHSDEKHEYKKSGLTVSANGGAADIPTNTIDDAKKASNARDKQLKALYGAEVYETIAKGKDSLNSILSGAASGATMEGLQPMFDTFLKDHPDMSMR